LAPLQDRSAERLKTPALLSTSSCHAPLRSARQNPVPFLSGTFKVAGWQNYFDEYLLSQRVKRQLISCRNGLLGWRIYEMTKALE